MEYEEAKYEVSQLGAKFLTEDEMTAILKGKNNLYIPTEWLVLLGVWV